MFDTHYDLLSIAYVCFLKNDYRYLEKICWYFNHENVSGVIANLYFMSLAEMKEELHPDYYKSDVSVLEMFKKSKEILSLYLSDIKIIYSIEGADFIKDEKELEELYNAGLNSLIIAWNTKSKYASGNRSDQGLTEAGVRLIKKAIDMGIGIDLSHANENTFNDLVDIIKNTSEDVTCYASHSNSKRLCDRNRNLTDEQLFKIKDINGLVGVFSNRNFIVPEERRYEASFMEKEELYIKHIKHIGSIVGFDHIVVSTDDMDFLREIDFEYGDSAIYDYSTIKDNLEKTLKRNFKEEVVYDIMYKNAAEKIYHKINKKRRNK